MNPLSHRRQRRTAALAACLPLAIIATGGCGVGEGTGSVRGTLISDPQTLLCNISADYDMKPDFFTAQPIDADPIVAPSFPANQLIVRLQQSGARVEDADALLFWIFDSAAVARCLRGASPGGVPEWDPLVCDRSPAVLGPNGEGRLYVGMTTEAVRSFFILNDTCPNRFVSANALGLCDNGSCPDVTLCPGRGSWISFSRFGKIPTNPETRIEDGRNNDGRRAFAIGDNEHITANIDPTGVMPSFHVELCDAATVLSKLQNLQPVRTPRFRGTLEGYFDFTFERGQAGQPFP